MGAAPRGAAAASKRFCARGGRLSGRVDGVPRGGGVTVWQARPAGGGRGGCAVENRQGSGRRCDGGASAAAPARRCWSGQVRAQRQRRSRYGRRRRRRQPHGNWAHRSAGGGGSVCPTVEPPVTGRRGASGGLPGGTAVDVADVDGAVDDAPACQARPGGGRANRGGQWRPAGGGRHCHGAATRAVGRGVNDDVGRHPRKREEARRVGEALGPGRGGGTGVRTLRAPPSPLFPRPHAGFPPYSPCTRLGLTGEARTVGGGGADGGRGRHGLRPGGGAEGGREEELQGKGRC